MTDHPTTPLVDFLLARLDEDEVEDSHAVAWRLLGTTRTVAITYAPFDVEVTVPGEYDLVGGRLPMTGIRRTVVELCVLPWLTSNTPAAELAGRILYAMCRPYAAHPDYSLAVGQSRERNLYEFPPSHLAGDRPNPAEVGTTLTAPDGTDWIAEGPSSWTEVPGTAPVKPDAPADVRAAYAAVLEDMTTALAEETGTPVELLHVSPTSGQVIARRISPDCAVGKCPCTGSAYDDDLEDVVPCEHHCHAEGWTR